LTIQKGKEKESPKIKKAVAKIPMLAKDELMFIHPARGVIENQKNL
jgi:hypothetical protein